MRDVEIDVNGNELVIDDPYNKKIFYQNNSVSSIKYVKTKVYSFCSTSGKRLKDKKFYKNYLFSRLPIFKWLLFEYNFKKNIIHDVIAGFTVGVMSIPQTMGISLLANLPPVHGLYMSFFPIFVYFLFGTSRHLVVGAISVVGLFSGEIVQDMSDVYGKQLINKNISSNVTDEMIADYKVIVACSLAFFVGIIEILMGLTGLGIVTTYFSEPFISGYTCGSAIHATLSQVKELLGLTNVKRHSGAFKIPKTIFDLVFKIPNIHIPTLITSVLSIFYLYTFKEFINPRIKKRIKYDFPSELLLVIVATVASYFGNFNKNFQISIVKQIPKGLPTPKLPDMMLWREFTKTGITTALISFSISISLASLYSTKNKYKINSTQELYAYGATNIFGSFFGCFPSSGSLSRTSIMNMSGGKSQIASLFSAFIILVVILWIGPLFEPLPKACLASVMVVALKGLVMQVTEVRYFLKISKYEAISWIGTFLSVVLLDVDVGLFVGLIITILLITFRDQNIEFVKLVKFNDKEIYIDENIIGTKEVKKEYTNMKIFKIERPLYFVNINAFKKQFYKSIGVSPSDILKAKYTKVENTEKTEDELLNKQYFILDFSSVNYIDSSATKILLDIIEDYKKMKIFIFICQCQKNFIDVINRMNLVTAFENHLFISLEDVLLFIKSKKIKENDIENEIYL